MGGRRTEGGCLGAGAAGQAAGKGPSCCCVCSWCCSGPDCLSDSLVCVRFSAWSFSFSIFLLLALPHLARAWPLLHVLTQNREGFSSSLRGSRAGCSEEPQVPPPPTRDRTLPSSWTGSGVWKEGGPLAHLTCILPTHVQSAILAVA